MPLTESQVISIAAVAAEDLWQKAATNTLKPDSQRLQRRLRLLDLTTQNLFEKAFGQTFRDRRALLADAVINNTGTHDYMIGYDNDEGHVGLRLLKASWGDGSWALSIYLYHLAGYHRLDQVTVDHLGQRVMLLPPKGTIVPANTLPTNVEILDIKSAA